MADFVGVEDYRIFNSNSVVAHVHCMHQVCIWKMVEKMIFKKWNSYTKEKQDAILSADDGWIVRNILMHGNSLIPSREVKKYGVEYIERRFGSILGEFITVEKRETKELGTLFLAKYEAL